VGIGMICGVRSVSVVVCSEQQCDVPSNEIVRLKGFVWIHYVLTDEFARANFPLFFVGKERV